MSRLHQRFLKVHGYELNLENPLTFSEKVQWIKRYGNLERFCKYVDKYAVRSYIKKTIGEEYLIPLIGVYRRTEDIEVNSLPNSFVIKSTHAARWNLIVKDKSKVNWTQAMGKMRKWLRSSYYKRRREPNYKYIIPRLVIEEKIEDVSGDLKDYKFFCFNGEPKYIQVDAFRSSNHRRDFYDTNWTKLPIRLRYRNLRKPLDKPSKLNEMIEVARKLSKDFPFVRVDLYFANEKIYFGELTFTPGNGLKKFTPTKYDHLFGEHFDLSKY